MNHTPTPWYVFGSDSIYSGADRGRFGDHVKVADCETTPMDKRPAPPTEAAKANAARIVACVNACEGIADPAEAIRKAREALREIRETIKNLADDEDPSDVLALVKVDAALAALGKPED